MDLLPWSDAVLNLERLLQEALQLPKELETLEASWIAPPGTSEVARAKLKSFQERVIERSDHISEIRAARILRQAIPAARVVGTAAEPALAYEPLRAWANAVIGNIESELEGIERQQALYVTLLATVIAMFAAIAATVSALFDLTRGLHGP